jgi:hypothetical protein
MSDIKHPDFTETKVPGEIKLKQPSVFLAGSINMGMAKPWQEHMTKELSNLPIHVLNPRRDGDLDPTWRQEMDYEPFKEQVDWEMNRLDDVDVIALYFQSEGPSPISLLELGLYAASEKLIVCCEKGFWRRGNVQIVCDRYGVKLVETEEELIAETRERLEELIGVQDRCNEL